MNLTSLSVTMRETLRWVVNTNGQLTPILLLANTIPKVLLLKLTQDLKLLTLRKRVVIESLENKLLMAANMNLINLSVTMIET